MISISIKKWKRRDIILLLERLEMYYSSGLQINLALFHLEDGLRKNQQISMVKIRQFVESGGLLSAGLDRYICLPKTISGLIEHGELSGNLTKTLTLAKSIMEKEEELLKRCTGALVYPIVIGLFTIVLTVGLLKGVMSQIVPMLKGLDVPLPFLTRLMIGLSEVVSSYGLYILFGCLGVFLVWKIFIIKTNTWKIVSQNLILKTPFLGNLVYNYHIALFLHSCGSLIESGLQVKDAYMRITASVSYIPLRHFLLVRTVDVARGISLGTVLNQKYTPSYVKPLLNAGETSGVLGLSTIRAGNIVDKEIEHTLKKFTSLIEPVMMVAMGCIVGALALSIMLPIYNISGALQK